MKKICVAIFYLFCGLGLQGCSTIKNATGPSAPCKDLNWYELGRADGIRGEPSLSWEKRVANCEGFGDSEHRSYTNGWYAGVDAFCSESHGYVFGKTGQPYYDVCPKSKEAAFLSTYKQGLRVFLFEKTLDNLTSQIEEKQTLVSESSSAEGKAKILMEINTLEQEKVVNQSQLSKIENKMQTLSL